MEVKINNNGEMLDATIEMVDGVMVVSPKKVKFEPKDGDVVYPSRHYDWVHHKTPKIEKPNINVCNGEICF